MMTPPIMSMGSAEGPPTLALTGNRSSCLAPRLVTILIGRISIWAPVSEDSRGSGSLVGLGLPGGDGEAQC